uniref:Mitogen-activated protein kinase n=1 Tax=Timema monikensis TaxID=170555 RepID=A0A7R9EC72_9NEOP|nr:unnamed protein product [Timema monikensis]
MICKNLCLAAVTSDSQHLGTYLNVDCQNSALNLLCRGAGDLHQAGLDTKKLASGHVEAVFRVSGGSRSSYPGVNSTLRQLDTIARLLSAAGRSLSAVVSATVCRRAFFVLFASFIEFAFGCGAAVTDPRDGRRVALKKLPNVFQSLVSSKRVFRELKMLCFFKHENVSNRQPRNAVASARLF